MVSSATSEWRRNRRRKRSGESPQRRSSLTTDSLKEEDAIREVEGVEHDNDDNDDNEEEEEEEYVSAAKRLRREREAAATSDAFGGEARGRRRLGGGGEGSSPARGDDDHDQDAKRRTDDDADRNDDDDDDDDDREETSAQVVSLLQEAAELQKKHASLTAEERRRMERDAEESRIMKEASKVQTNALQAASELARGVTYDRPFRTSWSPPGYVIDRGPRSWNETRRKWHIIVESADDDENDQNRAAADDDNDVNVADCPPPLRSFEEMKFPAPILEALASKNIKRPTPIQMQGLPVALAGRDMVGIAFTGSGKTMTFSLPLVMAALEEEVRQPLVGGEGPVGVILAPSRELARQTFEVVEHFCDALRRSSTGRRVDLRAALLIGGQDPRTQAAPFRERGVHCVVATPGRLRDFLKRRTVSFAVCRYVCLDEADRMLDLGFDEEVGEIMNFFPHQRQTLLFSATFPRKFRDFAKSTLVQPVVVNVGRAGAANLDVIQEVEYVKQEARVVYLLECLQKTAPPVVVFCERKGDVDDVHEYLLLKGVAAVGIHGGKDQEERDEAVRSYKRGEKDVLVATDVAAKGLDFADIQHVINFDMPSEIENYVHRIGRTGRCGRTGVATTFINKSCEETTLLDLKHLLIEARQRVPPVLMIMDDPVSSNNDNGGASGRGCAFCGGLGHTVADCPKIDKDARRVAGGHRDAIASGDGYGGEY